jgi:hypothetical protein
MEREEERRKSRKRKAGVRGKRRRNGEGAIVNGNEIEMKWTEREREGDVEGRKKRNMRRANEGRRGKGKDTYMGR